MSGILNGATQVETTFLGIGERTGNIIVIANYFHCIYCENNYVI
ncbi:hypothetical protein KPL48_21405 [Clostridium estertheticum]|nr:hypothetical protein [Clostridium estertheticum]